MKEHHQGKRPLRQSNAGYVAGLNQKPVQGRFVVPRPFPLKNEEEKENTELLTPFDSNAPVTQEQREQSEKEKQEELPERGGFFKAIKGIKNLGKAAKQSPSEFKGQLSSELLGIDVSQPFPNERQQATEEKQLLDKQGYQPKDFEQPVTHNMELSKDLNAQLAELGDGEYEFGEQQDELHGVDAVKEEITEQPKTKLQEKTADGLVGPFSSAGERSHHLIGSMTKGVSEWWGKNKFKIMAVVVAGIVGLIAANILTGGAVMAALPLLMKIVSVYFAGEAVYGMAKHFGRYLTASWPGNLAKGAKSLARAFAVGAVELVFALLFGGKAAVKGLRSVAKTAQKSGIKGVAKMGSKATKGAINSSVKTAKNLGTTVKNGAKNTVKNGKFAMQGIKRGALKGVKSLDEAGPYLGKKFRFKKFRLRVKNSRFKLEGKINPWVLFADGSIDYVKQGGLSRESGAKGAANVGDFVKNGKRQGVVVGAHSTTKGGVRKATSGYIRDLQDAKKFSNTGRVNEFRKLKGAVDDTARKALIRAGESTAALRKGIKGLKPKNFQAHHIIPREVYNQFEDFFKAIGFNLDDGARNGIMLPPNKEILEEFLKNNRGNQAVIEQFRSRSLHLGSHPKYTRRIEDKISAYVEEFKTINNPSNEVLTYYGRRIDKLLGQLRTGLDSGTIKLS